MFKTLRFFVKIFSIAIIFNIVFSSAQSEESDIEIILNKLQNLQSDIQTLEKAVYSSNTITQSSVPLDSNDEDALTRHLL